MAAASLQLGSPQEEEEGGGGGLGWRGRGFPQTTDFLLCIFLFSTIFYFFPANHIYNRAFRFRGDEFSDNKGKPEQTEEEDPDQRLKRIPQIAPNWKLPKCPSGMDK